MTTRLVAIADALRAGLAACGETIRTEESQEDTSEGVLVLRGHHALTQQFTPPYIVIVKGTSEITPSQSTSYAIVDATHLTKIADRIGTYEVHVFTPRLGDPDAADAYAEALADNVICALLWRSGIAQTFGARGVTEDRYPDDQTLPLTLQSVHTVITLEISSAVVQRTPPTNDMLAETKASFVAAKIAVISTVTDTNFPEIP